MGILDEGASFLFFISKEIMFTMGHTPLSHESKTDTILSNGQNEKFITTS